MSERSYTVNEIDALRQACELRWLFGTTRITNRNSRSFNEAEKSKCVEEMVRTHMMAGHTAKDLYEADNPQAA